MTILIRVKFFRKGKIMESHIDTNNKTSIYYGIASVLLLIVASLANITRLFSPLFDKVSKGNYTPLFTYVSVLIIWILCLWGIARFYKKRFDINLLRNSIKKERLPTINVISLWVLTYGGIILICYFSGWQFKLIYDLGERIAVYELYATAALLVLRAAESVIITAIIKGAEEFSRGFVKIKLPIPCGGIFLFLTYGVLVYFLPGGLLGIPGIGEPGLLFWLYCILYGIIYKLSGESFPLTALLIWLISVL